MPDPRDEAIARLVAANQDLVQTVVMQYETIAQLQAEVARLRFVLAQAESPALCPATVWGLFIPARRTN
jgi:hypothetical protein